MILNPENIAADVLGGFLALIGGGLLLLSLRDAATILHTPSGPLLELPATRETLLRIDEASRCLRRAQHGVKGIVVGSLLLSGGLTTLLHLGKDGAVLVLVVGSGGIIALRDVAARARDARRTAFALFIHLSKQRGNRQRSRSSAEA